MGSKNLKVIATRGTGSLAIARPKEALELRAYIDTLYGPKPGETAIGFKGNKLTGRRARGLIHPFTPTKQTSNYGEPLLSTMADEIKQGLISWRPTSCHACPGGCKSGIKVRGGEIDCGSTMCNILRAPADAYNAYYHTRGNMSKNTWEWTQLHQQLGLNHHETPDGRSASLGTTGSQLVKDLIKTGILTEKNTGWPTDKYGSLEFSRLALLDIAYKRGFGKVWAEGICRAIDYIVSHEEFGPNRDKAVYYRDLTFPKAGNFNGYQSHYRHGPEGIYYANLLYYSLSQGDGNKQHVAEWFYRGLRHFLTPGSDEWKTMLAAVMKKYTGTDEPIGSPGFKDCEKAVRWFWQLQMEMESLEFCNYTLQGWCDYTQDGVGDYELGSKMLNVVTGWDWTQAKLWNECERLWILERAIACREGRQASDDEFNDSWLKENPMAVSADGERYDKAKIREGLDKLYTLVGWNRNGVPTRARLEELDLKDVADDLENRGVSIS